jgi:LacI family transcriptional regulator
MRVTIKDIAKELGLSAAAVSKALNDKEDISQEIKAKVKEKAKEMNYQKNETAARLVSKKSNTIGVFVFARDKIKMEESSAFKYIEVYLNRVKNLGYDVLLFSIDDDDNINNSVLKLCLERNVEGVIIIGANKNQKCIQDVIDYSIPTVFVEANITGNLTTNISFNDVSGIEKSIAYLENKGHKRIAFIRGDLRTDLSRTRFLTYVNLISQFSEYNDNFVFQGDFSLESGYEVAQKVIELKEKPTAIVSSGDLMAIGLMRGLKEKGIKIPEDISIIGYDGFEIGRYIGVPLTTIKQDFLKMANETVDMLFEMIENKIVLEPRILEVELIIGESVRQMV